LAPWADALFAMDRQWWSLHYQEVRANFRGDRFSSNQQPVNYNVRKTGTSVVHHGNSGAAAIAMAASMGAARIILLGYDCQKTGGKAHWHGDHPSQLGNAGMINRWPHKFRELSKTMTVPVINCSRATALDCFPRMDLDEALAT
jgi:hypothetical protein